MLIMVDSKPCWPFHPHTDSTGNDSLLVTAQEQEVTRLMAQKCGQFYSMSIKQHRLRFFFIIILCPFAVQNP